MNLNTFVGVDPASGDFECAFIGNGAPEAVLGQPKNNPKDAVAVAYFAREQAAQGNLEIYRRTWFPVETLRPLVRLYEQKQREATRKINRLWQRIQNAFGAITAAPILSEIADISRFPNDDHPASYAGLGRREHKTGSGTTERNTFFAAARNYP